MPIAVQPANSADQDLSSRILSYLQTLNLQNLSVTVSNGEVLLSGKLASDSEKYLAVNACQRVAGVLKLSDSIEVAS